MAAPPIDLISDMAAIAEHHEEGIRQHLAGWFTKEERAEHQRITYVALMVLGVDRMSRLVPKFLRPRRAMPTNEKIMKILA